MIRFLCPNSDLKLTAAPMTAPHRAPFSGSVSKTIATTRASHPNSQPLQSGYRCEESGEADQEKGVCEGLGELSVS